MVAVRGSSGTVGDDESEGNGDMVSAGPRNGEAQLWMGRVTSWCERNGA